MDALVFLILAVVFNCVIGNNDSNNISIHTESTANLGEIHDIDATIATFFEYDEYLAYFRNIYRRVRKTFLTSYSEYAAYHWIIQALIYANVVCTVPWDQANSLMVVFNQHLRTGLGWNLKEALFVINGMLVVDPCRFKAVQCHVVRDLHPKCDITEIRFGNQLHARNLQLSTKSKVYLNRTLPESLTFLEIQGAMIYHFDFLAFPSKLEALKISNSLFVGANATFDWNTIGFHLKSIQIVKCKFDAPKFWNSKNYQFASDYNFNISIHDPTNAALRHVWFKPNLQQFSIEHCPTFSNDPTSVSIYHWLQNIKYIAPSLKSISLTQLDLIGVIDIPSVFRETGQDVTVKLEMTSLDIIGGRILCHNRFLRLYIAGLRRVSNDPEMFSRSIDEFVGWQSRAAQCKCFGQEPQEFLPDVEVMALLRMAHDSSSNQSGHTIVPIPQKWIRHPQKFVKWSTKNAGASKDAQEEEDTSKWGISSRKPAKLLGLTFCVVVVVVVVIVCALMM